MIYLGDALREIGKTDRHGNAPRFSIEYVTTSGRLVQRAKCMLCKFHNKAKAYQRNKRLNTKSYRANNYKAFSKQIESETPYIIKDNTLNIYDLDTSEVRTIKTDGILKINNERVKW